MMLRRFNRVDSRQIDQACSMYVSCGAIFAYSGLSFPISARMLAVARTLIREGSVPDLFVCAEAEFVYHYLLGNWSEEHGIDDELVERALRFGQVWDFSTYLGLECDRRLRRGEFDEARTFLARLAEIKDVYGYAFAGANHDGMSAILLLEERNLRKALGAAERYCAGRHEDALKVFSLGLIAKAQVLLGERGAAAEALARAEELATRSGQISPWHRSSYLVSRLLFDVTALEDAGRDGDRTAVRPLRRRAKRSARAALGHAAMVAKERTETYRLAGQAAWLAGDQRRALTWWERSMAEGERLGARPELARTCLEIGRRLPAGHELNGLDASAYLRRAEQLFSELGLDWDLERLRGAEPAAAERASASA
jgi:hypothetical protein